MRFSSSCCFFIVALALLRKLHLRGNGLIFHRQTKYFAEFIELDFRSNRRRLQCNFMLPAICAVVELYGEIVSILQSGVKQIDRKHESFVCIATTTKVNAFGNLNYC